VAFQHPRICAGAIDMQRQEPAIAGRNGPTDDFVLGLPYGAYLASHVDIQQRILLISH
jgi:hypothetical protein